MAAKIKEKIDASVEGKLKSLYQLQLIDSKIDRLKTVRGELPLEVSDLEDTVLGLETRLKNVEEEVAELETTLNEKKQAIKDFQANIKKYEQQQGKVRNNREYDAITKEVEFQNLEIQLAEKRIKEAKASVIIKSELLEKSKIEFEERSKDLKAKKGELDEIISETEKEEKELIVESQEASANIEDRLLNAYRRIRSNSRNGLAVVAVERDACGGCYNKIPPQRQLDIRLNKKIIVCEHCGRILVDGMLIPDSGLEDVKK
ncbi:MAG: C4-type zinc ribbon domain-containing protein [Bacteroidota bacterium]|nr:C4-type zinc ribbon domain-containing protein [Bacteroidota bacterium]MDP3145077.1 C4-type zinc ribbon domain-containing protein [Bacteroidota bacterium]